MIGDMAQRLFDTLERALAVTFQAPFAMAFGDADLGGSTAGDLHDRTGQRLLGAHAVVTDVPGEQAHVEVDDTVRARSQLTGDGLELETVALSPVERQSLVARGVPAEAALPGGFELVDAAEVDAVSVPTVHLVHSDGLYTLSVYVQMGRLATSATAGALALDLPDGGVVWRWPGSEPRRVVWSGDGMTFTALTDAPTSTLLMAVGGLPNDPAPSTLARVARGVSRAVDHLLPPWG
jgi:hypothetical protein